jgi:hypothetical protein
MGPQAQPQQPGRPGQMGTEGFPYDRRHGIRSLLAHEQRPEALADSGANLSRLRGRRLLKAP